MQTHSAKSWSSHLYCSNDKGTSRPETLLPGGRCWYEETHPCMDPQLPTGLVVSGCPSHFPDNPCCDLTLSVFCWVMFLSGGFALPSAEPAGTVLCYPAVLVFCWVMSAEDESSFHVNGSADDVAIFVFHPSLRWCRHAELIGFFRKKGLKTMLVSEEFRSCSSPMWKHFFCRIASLSLFWQTQTLLWLKCFSGVYELEKQDKSLILQYCQLGFIPLMPKRESHAVVSSNLL